MPEDPDKSRVRFLEIALNGALQQHVLTPEGLLEHFPPDGLMADILKDRPLMRANVLTNALKLEGDFLMKLGPNTAGDLLRTAFEAGEADAGKIVEANTCRAWAEALPSAALWTCITSREWWQNPDDAERQLLKLLLEAVLSYEYMPSKEYLDLLAPKELAPALSKKKLEELFVDIAITGHREEVFRPERVFKIIGVSDFFDGMRPAYLFDRIVRRAVELLGVLQHIVTNKPLPETLHATPAVMTEEDEREPEAPKKRRGKTATLALGSGSMDGSDERSKTDPPVETGWSVPPENTMDGAPNTKSFGTGEPKRDPGSF